MIGNSDDQTNFPHKLLVTDRQVANLCRAFANHPLLKTRLPLMKSLIQPLAKIVLIPLGLTAAAAAVDAGIHKKILGSGHNTNLIISNDEMKDILKTVKSLEDSGLLLKGVSETIKDEAKEQKGAFLSMLLGTLGSSLLGNMLAGEGVMKAGEGTAKVD